jgi:hypothetical protein
MNQMMLFDIEQEKRTGETMQNMTWLDLYNFLHKNANDINNFENAANFWNSHVMIHNAETGDEYPSDTWMISDSRGKDRLVLVINSEGIYD